MYAVFYCELICCLPFSNPSFVIFLSCPFSALKHLLALTCRTIFLWMANFAMMWASSKWPLYLQAGSTQALGRRHGQAKVIRRRSLLLRDLLLSWIWWGACSTSRVENCSRQIRRESSRSACFSGSRTLERDRKEVALKIAGQQRKIILFLQSIAELAQNIFRNLTWWDVVLTLLKLITKNTLALLC